MNIHIDHLTLEEIAPEDQIIVGGVVHSKSSLRMLKYSRGYWSDTISGTKITDPVLLAELESYVGSNEFRIDCFSQKSKGFTYESRVYSKNITVDEICKAENGSCVTLLRSDCTNSDNQDKVEENRLFLNYSSKNKLLFSLCNNHTRSALVLETAVMFVGNVCSSQRSESARLLLMEIAQLLIIDGISFEQFVTNKRIVGKQELLQFFGDVDNNYMKELINFKVAQMDDHVKLLHLLELCESTSVTDDAIESLQNTQYIGRSAPNPEWWTNRLSDAMDPIRDRFAGTPSRYAMGALNSMRSSLRQIPTTMNLEQVRQTDEIHSGILTPVTSDTLDYDYYDTFDQDLQDGLEEQQLYDETFDVNEHLDDIITDHDD